MINFKNTPAEFVQFGTIQEQDILLKAADFYNGLIVKANLITSFPGATYSFLQKIGKDFFIDPITYIFASKAEYLCAEEDSPKDVYLELAGKYLSKFQDNLKAGQATDIYALKSDEISTLTKNVINFQKHVWDSVGGDVDVFQKLLNEISTPVVPIFYIAPYFVIRSNELTESLRVNTSLIDEAAKLENDIAAIIPLEKELLDNSVALATVAEKYSKTKASLFIFWIDNFDEIDVSPDRLNNLVVFIEALKKKGRVMNLFGGFLSAMLTKKGLDAFAHGLAYSERRGFEPVQGMMPTPMYYFLPFHQRYPVDKFISQFSRIKAGDFKTKVCSCLICEKLLSMDPEPASAMSDYLEIQKWISFKIRSRSGNLMTRRKAIYTKRSHQLARYHYIFNKHKELTAVKSDSFAQILNKLQEDKEYFSPIGFDVSPIAKWAGIVELLK